MKRLFERALGPQGPFLLQELRGSSGLWGIVAAAGGLVSGRGSALSRAAGAVAAGAVTWKLVDGLSDASAEARNAADAAVVAQWLGESGLSPGAWAAESDFARLAVDGARFASGPMVELGSGLSTVLVGRFFQQRGSGTLYSVEHDPAFAAEMRELIAKEGLADHVVVVEAQLVTQRVAGEEVPWYDSASLDEGLPTEIGCLVVDGPPALSPWARWPALPLLAGRLRDDATVLLDDGRRDIETGTAYRWADEHPDRELCWVDTVKGAWMLRPRPGPAPSSGGPHALVRTLRRRLNPHPRGFGRWPVIRS